MHNPAKKTKEIQYYTCVCVKGADTKNILLPPFHLSFFIPPPRLECGKRAARTNKYASKAHVRYDINMWFGFDRKSPWVVVVVVVFTP